MDLVDRKMAVNSNAMVRIWYNKDFGAFNCAL